MGEIKVTYTESCNSSCKLAMKALEDALSALVKAGHIENFELLIVEDPVTGINMNAVTESAVSAGVPTNNGKPVKITPKVHYTRIFEDTVFEDATNTVKYVWYRTNEKMPYVPPKVGTRAVMFMDCNGNTYRGVYDGKDWIVYSHLFGNEWMDEVHCSKMDANSVSYWTTGELKDMPRKLYGNTVSKKGID